MLSSFYAEGKTQEIKELLQDLAIRFQLRHPAWLLRAQRYAKWPWL